MLDWCGRLGEIGGGLWWLVRLPGTPDRVMVDDVLPVGGVVVSLTVTVTVTVDVGEHVAVGLVGAVDIEVLDTAGLLGGSDSVVVAVGL